MASKALEVTRSASFIEYDPDSPDGYDYASVTVSLAVNYTYDTEGKVTSVSYPGSTSATGVSPYSSVGWFTLNYGFDNMGRPVSLTDNYPSSPITWAQNVQYDYAGRMTSLEYLNSLSGNTYTTKTTSYNVNGQLASLNFSGGLTGGIQYNYSATQNNGQITQAGDTISGRRSAISTMR